MAAPRQRVYRRTDACAFRTTRGPWGLLSNFAPTPGGIVVNGLRFATSEALYQALKSTQPAVQARIAAAATPKAAKAIGRGAPLRADWEQVKVEAMRLTLRLKAAAPGHAGAVQRMLAATGTRPIVEDSRHDAWWGARPQPDGRLIGHNVLGRLWMELREEIRTGRARTPAAPVFAVNGQAVAAGAVLQAA